MKLGLDLEKLRSPNSGLGQFCLHLAQNILPLRKATTLYLPKSHQSCFKNANTLFWKNHHRYMGVPIDCDIWHATHQESPYFPKNKNTKRILTIHDLNVLHKYKGYKRRRHHRDIQRKINKSSALTFISNFTKQQVNRHFSIPKHIVQTVIYNGLTIDLNSPETKPNFIKSNAPFLFNIGIVGIKKNIHTLVDMMDYVPDFNLYICGNKNSSYAQKIAKQIQQHNLENRIFLTGPISEGEKKWMYKNCSAFVFPSILEGFGLPVLEALQYSKQCVLSPHTALPEIGGNASHFFENFNPKQMAQTVLNAIENPIEKHLIETHYQQFSWEKSTRKYIELYRMSK